MKTKHSCVLTVDARDVFQRTVVAMCREVGLQRRLSPVDIDAVVRDLVADFAGTLEEFSEYIEREDWDGLASLAARERTMAQLRSIRRR